MSEFLSEPAKFTNIYGVSQFVGVTPEWEVYVDDTHIDRFSLLSGVVVQSFVVSLDTIQPRKSFYEIADNQYLQAINNRGATEIPGGEVGFGSSLGKYLDKVMKPDYSPFKTNLISVKLGVRDMLFILRNPHLDDSVLGVLAKTELSENPDVNLRFREQYFVGFQRRKEFLLRNTRIKATETDTHTSNDETIDAPQQQVEPMKVSTDAQDKDKVLLTPVENIEVQEYIGSDLTIPTLGAHILDTESGDKFTQFEIMQKLKINPNDADKVRTALVALTNARYLKSVVRDEKYYFVRTELLKPAPKIS